MKVRVFAAACLTAFFAAPALAADINHYICRSGDRTIIEDSKAVKVYSWIDKGLIVGQVEKEAFHAMNSRCTGVVELQKLKKGANSGNGYCKYADKDGDATVLSWKFKGKDRTWRFISGSGKWAGVTGGGVFKNAVRSKTLVKGSFQSCVHVTGSYKVTM